VKFKDELKWIVPLALVCLVVFANALGGDFVYDDTRQILRNTLIQDNALIWKALTSDVWAFKGDGSIAASNYWRPTFTAWHIINFRLFGTNPIGWHVTNLLLHSGVCVMIFASLRRWAFPAVASFSIALIFAVHPVHVESVAWISGSPDLLFALLFLSSLWFAKSYSESGTITSLILTVLLYALALGAKEIGILCLPIFYFVSSGTNEDASDKSRTRTELMVLGAVAVGYFFIRFVVLGAIARPPDDPVPLWNAVLSVPEIFAFYVRQMLFPYWLGANYPVEPVYQVGLTNFFIPLVVSISALAAIYFLARSSPRGRLAAAIFLLPLITAMNATAFISEQIVHDRYLYLPLLGALMLIVPFAIKLAGERTVLVACVVVAVLLSVQTFVYNAAWKNELSLWTRTVANDSSSFTAMQYGSALSEAGRDQESIDSYSTAIERKPVPRAFIGRGRGYLKLRQYQNAEADLVKATQFPADQIEAYALYQAYEALGITYTEQKKFDDAMKNFAEGRDKLPIYAAAITVNLAIVEYQNGLKSVALQELEGAQAQARKELLPESKSVFLRLGMLYIEARRRDDARNALREYLDLTSSASDKISLGNRAQASKILESLK